MGRRVVGAWVVGVSLLCATCAANKPTLPTPRFLAWSQQHAAPQRVCVLPFTDRTKTPGLARQVRQSFAGHLSVKRFADVELYQIDARLEPLGDRWRSHDPQHLAKTIGCDALVYGEVLTARRLYLGVYSQLTVEGTIRLIDGASGHALLNAAHATKFRSAGVPLSPLAVVPGAIMNFSNLSDAQMVRAIDDLGRHLAEKIPDPPVPVLKTQIVTPFPLAGEDAPLVARTLPHPLEPQGGRRPAEIASMPARKEGEPGSDRVTQAYRVQVASFRSHGEAKEAVRRLREKGYRPAIAAFTGADQGWHRVMLGPYPSREEAQQVGAEIQKHLRFSPVVLPRPHS